MSNNTNPNTNCTGCHMHCEYGYFQYGKAGQFYPTLNGQIIENYWVSRCEHKFIRPEEIRTAEQAIAMARKIALHCNQHCDKQR